jgi:PST family polysaccharide transporter
LVGGSLLSSTIATTGILLNRRCGYARPRFSELEGNVRFSGAVLGSRLAWFVYSNADFTVAGKRLGEAALGVYSLAWNLAEAPIEKVNAMLTDVVPSLFAAVQNDQSSLRRYFLNTTELLAFIIFPAAIGIAVTSPDLVATLLGPKWSAAVLPLAVLAGYAVVRSTTFLFGHVFLAVGDVKFTLHTATAFAIVLPIAFLIGSHWGATGIAVAWLIAHPPLMLVAFFRVCRILGMRARDYLRALRLGADGTAVMAVAVIASRRAFGIESNAARLIVDVAIGVAAFAGTTLLIHRGRLREIIAWLRRIRS